MDLLINIKDCEEESFTKNNQVNSTYRDVDFSSSNLFELELIFKKKDWFENYLNDCKVNLRLTLINSRHIGFLKSDETYTMISNIGSRSRFNFICYTQR